MPVSRLQRAIRLVAAISALVSAQSAAAGDICPASERTGPTVRGQYVLRFNAAIPDGLREDLRKVAYAVEPIDESAVVVTVPAGGDAVEKGLELMPQTFPGLPRDFQGQLTKILAQHGSNVAHHEPVYVYPTHAAAVHDRSADDGTWWMDKIGEAEALGRMPPGSVRQIVAVVDTGIYAAHDDFKDLLWWREENGARIFGRNFLSEDPCRSTGESPDQTCDDWGHGTAVAGLIASNGSVTTGVLPRARLMILKAAHKVADAPDCVDTPCVRSRDGALAIKYAARLPETRVINLSWGAQGSCSEELYHAIEYAKDRGVLVVAALDEGNDVDNDVDKIYPAGFDLPNIIRVGGIADEKSAIASGHTKDALFAPMNALRVPKPGCSQCVDTNAGGTSMSAAEVSGAVMMVWSLAGSWDAAKVKKYLFEAATPTHWLDQKTWTEQTYSVLNLNSATSAPVAFGQDTGKDWVDRAPHRVRWAPRFNSAVCPNGEFVLRADDGSVPEQAVGVFPWTDCHVDVTPKFNIKSALDITLEARCPGTKIAAAEHFVLLPKP